ncbi:MAG: lysophospholipid acyltransferase family protein [Armatimonadetes bacterium]|nr:lysophospholipid acyltransferase family protein [Armatimonadota bacterium]
MQASSATKLTTRAKKLPPAKKCLKLIGRITFWWLFRAAGLFRPWSVKLLGDSLGMFFFGISRRYRKGTLKNLRNAFGDQKTEAEIQKIAKGVFKHFMRGAFEFFYLLSLSRDQIDAMIDMAGKEHLDEALARGKGCIIVTAHYGNWELLARKLVILGYKVNVIARDSDDAGMTGITQRIRESGGYKVFDRDQPIIGAFRALKNNEILGILPDQNDIGGIFVPFFGRLAATAVGPAVLSMKSGAPIVPVFAPRVENGKYLAAAHPMIKFEPSGDEDRDKLELMTLVNKAIEDEVRRNPSQWLWMHDRWKLSPEAGKHDG